jgi:hypothetical protein
MKKQTIEQEDWDQNPEELEEEIATPKTPEEIASKVFFDSVVGAEWEDGIALQPLSLPRVNALYRAGLRYGMLNKDEVETAQATGFYAGIETDPILVAWICLQPVSTAYRALRMPPEWLVGEAMRWAEKEDMYMGSEGHGKALEWMIRAFDHLAKSRAEYVDPNAKKPGKKRAKRGNA